MFNMNSGYNGYRMSNRAVQAYEDGEMPLSKWTKEKIIRKVVEYDHFTKEELKKYTKKVLTKYFLIESSWHHTSSYCNKTYFYSIDENVAETGSIKELEAIKKEYTAEREPDKIKKVKVQKAKIKYLEWGGTRSHPKATEVKGYAIIIGKWAFLCSGKKKSLSSNGFKILETYSRAPKGTAEEFKMIIKKLPVSVKKKIEG